MNTAIHPGNDEAAARHTEMLSRRFHIRSEYTGVTLDSAHTRSYAELLQKKFNSNLDETAPRFVLIDTHANTNPARARFG